MPEWERVVLGELLTRSRETVAVDAQRTYKQVTVRMKHKGVVLREEKSGATIGTTRQFLARTGQFIISSIDARNGANGLIPESLNGAIVTNDFWLFNVDSSRLDREWLDLYSSTPDFVEACTTASEGTTNRVRLKEDRFLALEIPLPPLPEQQRIVARVKGLLAKVEEAVRLRELSIAASTQVLSAELHQKFTENHHDEHQVGDLAEIIDPNPSHRMPHYKEEGIPFISTVDFFGTEEISRRTKKYVARDTYEAQLERCNFSVNDILYCRIGSIGKSRLITEIWEFALSHVLVVVKPKTEIVDPRYLLWYLRSDAITSQATEATRSMGVPDLGIKRIREFKIPLPPIPEQKRIARRLDELQGKLDSLMQTQQLPELQALPASILAQAFAGAL